MRSGSPRVSVGIDLVEVAEIEASVRRFGDKYLDRVFTPLEIQAYRHSNSARTLAACFAAKEAALKALALDGEAVSPHSLEVRGLDTDEPALVLSGAASALAERRALRPASVSVGAAGGYAVAVVLLERP
jgi:holo-[acyl-carrier protein] synthase